MKFTKNIQANRFIERNEDVVDIFMTLLLPPINKASDIKTSDKTPSFTAAVVKIEKYGKKIFDAYSIYRVAFSLAITLKYFFPTLITHHNA